MEKNILKAYLLTSKIVQGGHVLPIIDINLCRKREVDEIQEKLR